MAQYRKKPVVIEAEQYQGGVANPWGFDAVFNYADNEYQLLIPTLEGVMKASPGDWIITGVKGEVYPCKPDIFAATYDAA